MFNLSAKKQEIEQLQRALRESEAQRQEAVQLITELQSQLEHVQTELQRKGKALRKSESQRHEVLSQLEKIRHELIQERVKNQHPAISDKDFLKLCKSGDVEKVEEAIMNGANINAHNICGWTALMGAARNCNAKIAEVLLKHGAEVNACNIWGGTALMEASEYGHTKVEELLLNHGADIDMEDNDGNTALTLSYDRKISQILHSYAERDQSSRVKTVPFSLFSEWKADKIFAEVRYSGPILVVDNNGNEICVLMNPENYES